VSEARSILRDAIEFVAHAHAMVKDPRLLRTWLCKDDGKAEMEAYKDAFDRNKRTVLFDGLGELHDQWCELSETGSHANMNAIYERLSIVETSTHVEFNLRYTGGHKPEILVSLIFTMLLTGFVMEDVFFKDYESRLKLDIELERMRREFAAFKEWLRKEIIARYKIPPPAPSTRKP